jgi:hypothetical protein
MEKAIQAETLGPAEKSLRIVIDYLWDDERRHFEENPPAPRCVHVFHHLFIVEQWLRENAHPPKGS